MKSLLFNILTKSTKPITHSSDRPYYALEITVPVCCYTSVGPSCSCNLSTGLSQWNCRLLLFLRRCWWQGGPGPPDASVRQMAIGLAAGWRVKGSWNGSVCLYQGFLVNMLKADVSWGYH